MRTAICFGLAALCLVACNRERKETERPNPGYSVVPGFSVGEDGHLRITSGKVYRKDYEKRFERAIDDNLNKGWRSEVSINPDARYLPDDDPGEDGWFWNWAEVDVALIGRGGYPVLDGKVGASQIEEMLVDFVTEKMREKMERGADLEVRVTARIEIPPEKDEPETIVEPVEGFDSGSASQGGGTDRSGEDRGAAEGVDEGVADGADGGTSPPPEESPEAVGKTVGYRVKKDDTLAKISITFYGTADHWDVIVAANPGLDGANLPVGEVIRVPLEPPGER